MIMARPSHLGRATVVSGRLLELMQKVGARTRFQAGMEAVSRGWL
jgi:hypothetical protein